MPATGTTHRLARETTFVAYKSAAASAAPRQLWPITG